MSGGGGTLYNQNDQNERDLGLRYDRRGRGGCNRKEGGEEGGEEEEVIFKFTSTWRGGPWHTGWGTHVGASLVYLNGEVGVGCVCVACVACAVCVAFVTCVHLCECVCIYYLPK